jgi:hypothetical protein
MCSWCKRNPSSSVSPEQPAVKLFLPPWAWTPNTHVKNRETRTDQRKHTHTHSYTNIRHAGSFFCLTPETVLAVRPMVCMGILAQIFCTARVVSPKASCVSGMSPKRDAAGGQPCCYGTHVHRVQRCKTATAPGDPGA